ncbi:unnamed protein product [Closterium sp. NIES-53]
MFQHIKDLVELDDSGPKAWKLLRDVIQPNTLPMVIVLEKELAALSMRPGDDVKPVLDKIKNTYARMAAAGRNVSQMQQCTKIISVLDNSWENLIPTLNTQQDQWTPEWLRQQILQEDFRRRHTGGGAANKTAEGTAPAKALHTFTLDSGASRCFFRDSTALTLPAPIPVRLADPSRGPVVARSSTVLPCPAVPSGLLSGLHLPSFSTNLTLLWHHRLGHPSLPRLRGMHSHLLVSGLPRSLPPVPPLPAPPCLPCVEGRQPATPHSSLFASTTARLQTLHMNLRGPARVNGQSRERYFLLVVDDYTRYTMVFPLRSKGQVVDVFIPWIRTVRLQLRERFRQGLPILRLHSDRGGEFSSNLLQDFCRGEGILQSFLLPDYPQQNGNAERRIGLVMEVARTSMIHAVATHFLWPFVVCVGQGRLAMRRCSESRAFVRDTSANKLSPCAIPYVFLGFVPDAPGWRFYHPTSHRVFPSQDVTFDESVPFYRFFPYHSAPPPPPPLFLAPGPSLVDPLPPQGPAPSSVSQVDPLPGPAPVQVAIDSGAARGAASGCAEPWGAESKGAETRGAELGGAERGGVATRGGEPWGAEREGVGPGGSAGASPRLSAQQLCEWFIWRTRLWSGASGAGGAGAAGAGGTGVAARAGVTEGTTTTRSGGARTQGTGAARTCGVEGAGAGDLTGSSTTGAGGAGAGGAGVGGPGSEGAGVGGPGVGGARAGGAGAIDPSGGSSILSAPPLKPCFIISERIIFI